MNDASVFEVASHVSICFLFKTTNHVESLKEAIKADKDQSSVSRVEAQFGDLGTWALDCRNQLESISCHHIYQFFVSSH